MLHLHFGKEVQIHQVITNFPMPIEWIRLKPWHQTLVLNIPSPLELLSLASNTKMESLLLPIQWEITEDFPDIPICNVSTKSMRRQFWLVLVTLLIFNICITLLKVSKMKKIFAEKVVSLCDQKLCIVG